MKLLLDTHILIWSVERPERLGRRTLRELNRSKNEIWLSPVSTWELLCLNEKGRLKLSIPIGEWITQVFHRVPCKEAPLTNDVVLAIPEVQLPVSDPADCFLAATARVFDLTLVTADERLLAGKGFRVMANT